MWVLAVSTPVIVFALVGGYLGQALAKDDTYQHLRVFDDVVTHVVNNYVEEVDLKQAMRGAMRGLAEALDADSAFLTPELVRTVESNTSAGPGDVGIELVRQYYLRVVSAREGSPAAKAGLRTGDFIRAIDNKPTRDMSAYEGARLLRGALGSKVALLVFRGNAADPHEIPLVRERIAGAELTVADGECHDRVRAHRRLHQGVAGADQAGLRRPGQVWRHALRDRSQGHRARRSRRRCRGSAALRPQRARWPSSRRRPGVTWSRQRLPTRSSPRRSNCSIDQGTAAAAEVFASALGGNDRAELIGERTLGRAARQQLVKLPDGSGLLLSSIRYLTPKNEGIHERGIGPDVEVDQPDVEFGATPPAKDETLDKALERLAEKKAA